MKYDQVLEPQTSVLRPRLCKPIRRLINRQAFAISRQIAAQLAETAAPARTRLERGAILQQINRDAQTLEQRLKLAWIQRIEQAAHQGSDLAHLEALLDALAASALNDV